MRAFENFTDLDLEIMDAAYTNQAIIERHSKLFETDPAKTKKRIDRLAQLREACIAEIIRRKQEAAA